MERLLTEMSLESLTWDFVWKSSINTPISWNFLLSFLASHSQRINSFFVLQQSLPCLCQVLDTLKISAKMKCRYMYLILCHTQRFLRATDSFYMIKNPFGYYLCKKKNTEFCQILLCVVDVKCKIKDNILVVYRHWNI